MATVDSLSRVVKVAASSQSIEKNPKLILR